MNPRDLLDDDEPGFFRRNLVMIILGLLALGGGGYYFATAKPSKATKTKKNMDMVMVMPVMPPPPPPPPPPKQEEPPPEEEKEEIAAAEEEPPPDAQEKPADKPAEEALGTALTGGDGSSGLGAGNGGGSGMIGGTGGRSYSERGRWQGKFGRAVQEILARNPELKFAKGSVPFRVWLDESGRITRVTLNGSTGDPRLDDVLRSKALIGQVLDPAPAGTPMPVIMRFSGR